MIEIDRLQCRYPDGTVAIKDLDITVPEGEFLLICGPNGSGKTTLIRHINGLLQPFAGSIRVAGIDVADAEEEVRKLVGMVFQDADSQIIGETVWDDVAFGPQNLGLSELEIQGRVDWALNSVALQNLADKPCHLLSGGEKRRLAIAGVLAMQPRVLIFDEPFANLDYSGVRQTLQQIITFHQKGHTVIVTTHDVEKVIAHVSRVVVLYDGELRADGPPALVVKNLSRYQIRPPCYSLLGSEPISWLTA
ncbi:energy-coupling factor ABC transporter ATP-binding protein [Desulfoferrobacter suflitae]|uniref:energy-coupling factor ABC transporter ATP-binding protein n=1 Tax=Desulfoferrobacter suflitae TaxID=2865782 RepID=UPI0021642F57|nr:ABC transporter ATP-binding protein [Desulfoferrobacter suflitae]MCK8600304.1 energy-coupling factor ABC transporter ATP-binding protein [Desulfoferrobacter suflitae]